MKIWTTIQILLGRAVVQTLGQLSHGIQLVTKKGLTSGVMLDYIYQNKPNGRLLIGKWIDKIYLSHAAWQDVRTRKMNLVRYLSDSIAIQRNLKQKPVIIDVAAGSARYIIDVKSQAGMEDVVVFCRDLNNEALIRGKHNADALGISDIYFSTGDALNAKSIAQTDIKPNIAVSSGFYDWINEDDIVKKSMALIYDILPSSGCFVFTNQSRHVNQEFVEGVFKNLYGQPLRMTMRSAAQMNEWAEDIGFNIVQTTGDKNFNYSVTLAEKP